MRYAGLTIPLVSPEVIAQYTFSRNGPALAAIAEGLCKAGILTESHWMGDLGSAVNVALRHWINERLFRYGRIAHHGYWINLESGRVNPIPVPQEK